MPQQACARACILNSSHRPKFGKGADRLSTALRRNCVMNSMKATIAATVLAGFAVTGATLSKAEDQAPVLTMKPLHAVSFDVGRKHAVSYFLTEKGQCKLTLVV